jgi:hypothetical protein
MSINNMMKTCVLSAFLSVLSISQAHAHGGGLDANGCHSKANVRHCHGEKAGLYIPENETTRIAKLHKTTCNTPDGEGRYPRHDLYGKRCKAR